MKITFLGAAQTVTGSKYLIEESKHRFLVDCGLFQGFKELRLRNWEPFAFNPKEIQGVILTHAHLDHSGSLPLLVKQGYKGPIYASKGTKDLCRILLLDSGRIQEEDARRANRYGYSKHKPALPLYTEKDAERAIELIRHVAFDKEIQLNNALTMKLNRSGHILGSSFVTLKNEGLTLVFSGDVGRPYDPIMKHPDAIEKADYLVLESTYGSRIHPKGDPAALLAEIINSTIKKGGTVVIPSFAVGRTQTVLYYLNKLKEEGAIPREIPVYLDSPMAVDATDLWCENTNEQSLSREETAQVCQLAHYVQSPEESKRLNTLPFPAIILSASGMAEGGRVLHHIKHYGPRGENSIVFAGFQAAGTRGDRLLRGEKEVKIHGQMIPIRARIENLETLSSHADYEELIDWLKKFKSKPKKVFLTHGELEAALGLKGHIEKAFGWDVYIPALDEVVELQ